MIIFSCPIVGVDSTFCCSKVKYSLLLKVTEFFTAVRSTSPLEKAQPVPKDESEKPAEDKRRVAIV